MKYCLFLAAFFLFSCNNVTKKEYQNPEVLWGELYKDIEAAGLFENPKEFWDAAPKGKADKLLPFYLETKNEPDFNLKKFVEAYLVVPDYSKPYKKSDLPFEEYVNQTFASFLTRPKDDGGSLIPTRMRYVQGGGMFPEYNYFSSYFGVMAYLAQGQDSLATDLTTNAFQFIQDYGYVPYGNRSYYLGFSGFPMLSMMAKAISEANPKMLPWFGNLMARDYQNWMQGKTAISLDDGKVLNRFFSEGKANAYIDLQKLTEWHGSSRYLVNGKPEVQDFLPIDLNAVLYQFEQVLATSFEAKGRKEYTSSYTNLAKIRKELYDKYFYNTDKGFYFDYDYVRKKASDAETLAAVFPLVVGMSSETQAKAVLDKLENSFLTPYGLKDDSSLDFGSAEMNYLAYLACKNYKNENLAGKIKDRWIQLNKAYYAENGHILRKYNLESPLNTDKTPERLDAALAILQLFLLD